MKLSYEFMLWNWKVFLRQLVCLAHMEHEHLDLSQKLTFWCERRMVEAADKGIVLSKLKLSRLSDQHI